MNLKKLAKNNFLIILAVLISYVGVILYSDIEKFTQIASRVDISRVIFASFLVGISMLLFAVRFHRLVRALQIPINIKKSILVYFFGLAFSVTPFSSGTIIKSHILKKDFDVPIAKTFPIILVEKWNELVAVVILLVLFLTLHFALEYAIITIVGIALVSVFFILIRSKKTFSVFGKITSKISFLRKFQEGMDESQQSVNILTSKKNTAEGITITIAAKILETVAVLVLFETIDFNLGIVSSGQVYFSGVILGFVSLIPGGLGVTEGSMLGLLLKTGNNFALASASVILIRLVAFWFPTILGLFTLKYFMKEKFSF